MRKRYNLFDLAIIGAGPAGSTLAREIDNGMKVLVLEKRRLDLPQSQESGGRSSKTCGGMLNSDAQRELARQGLSLPKSVMCDPQPFMVRAFDIDRGNERKYQRHYLNIHREMFDRFLFYLAMGAGKCDFRMGALVKDVRYVDGVYEIDFIVDGKRYKERAAMIAAADGGSSLSRRKLDDYSDRYKIGKTPYYAAVQEKIELDCSDWDGYGAYFAAGITDYYCWAIPKEGHVLLGGAFKPGKFAPTNFERMKSLLVHKGLPFGGRVIAREGAILQRPKSFAHIRPSACRAVFLGEAGGFISPSSSEGISWAMKTGSALANSLNSGGDIDSVIGDYKSKTFPMKAALVSKNARSFAMYNPAVRNLIMKSGITSIR